MSRTHTVAKASRTSSSNAASPRGLPILAAVALGAVLAGLLLSSLQRPRFGGAVGRGGRPDLVLVVADDLGFNDVGYNHAGGPGKLATPRIDALAAQSLRLTRFYGQPMCTPARAALVTGRHAHRLGLAYFVLLANQPTGLGEDETTFAERLRGAGYATHMVGKWHLGFAKKAWLPTSRGFDSFFGYCLGAQHYTKHESPEWLEGGIDAPRRRRVAIEAPGHDLWRDLVPLDRTPATEGVHSAELFAKEARRVIAEAEPATPLFLYYAAQTPHAHYVEGHAERHRAVARRLGFAEGADPRYDVAALVAALDEQVGSVADAMAARGGPAVLWFLGDNGPEPGTGASAYPLRGAKRACFEGGLRTPAFVYAPGLVRPGATNVPLHVVDVAPTLAALAGAPAGARGRRGVDGRDARRDWEGRSYWRPHRVLVLFYDDVAGCGAAVRGPLKYVLNGGCEYPDPAHAGWEDLNQFPQGGWVERNDDPDRPGLDYPVLPCVGPGVECLFDLEHDPAEQVDVKGRHPAVFDLLRAALLRAQAEAAPSRVRTTRGDPDANPSLHGGKWVSWLG